MKYLEKMYWSESKRVATLKNIQVIKSKKVNGIRLAAYLIMLATLINVSLNWY